MGSIPGHPEKAGGDFGRVHRRYMSPVGDYFPGSCGAEVGCVESFFLSRPLIPGHENHLLYGYDCLGKSVIDITKSEVTIDKAAYDSRLRVT